MNKKEQPLVSVIVVNYNGMPFIRDCLSSVLTTNYPNFEVILVDNVSTDGSRKYVQEKFGRDSRLKVIINRKNLGASCGRNTGLDHARGKYTAFIDNDTKVDTYWLEEMVKIFEKDSTVGAAQSKLLLKSNPRQFDSCGHYLSPVGFPFEIGVGEEDRGQYDKINEIFGAKSAAMMIRRSILDKIGPFDSDYFIYGEETDLCWRVRLAGYRVLFIPKSIVYHALGGTLSRNTGHRIFYEGTKNSTKNLIKNLGLGNLLWMLPLHTACWLGIATFLSLRGRFSDSLWIIKGLSWNVRRIGSTLEERKNIQRHIRKVADRKITPYMFGRPDKFSLITKGLAWLARL